MLKYKKALIKLYCPDEFPDRRKKKFKSISNSQLNIIINQLYNKSINIKSVIDNSKSLKNTSLKSSNLYNSLKSFSGKNIIASYSVDNNIILTKNYNVPDKQFSKWWNKSSRDWWVNSETLIFDSKPNGTFVIFEENTFIQNDTIFQHFKDGINHCVLHPIRLWTNSLKTPKKINSFNNKLDKYDIIYVDGIPETSIDSLCKSLNININIYLPLCNIKLYQYYSKNANKTFNFVNTRKNHVELFNNNLEIINVSRNELLNIKLYLDNNNLFYTYTKDFININSISTLSHKYIFHNPFNDICNLFETTYGLDNCKIDDLDNKELSLFIFNGTNYNSTVDFINIDNLNIDDIYHIDMSKAYANFKSCKYFNGFLGKITDFRYTDSICGIGLYQINNIVFNNNNLFKKLNDKLNIYHNGNIYTSPELSLLKDMGVSFDIICGCWGIEPFYFDFDDIMLNNTDENDCKYYAKWTGRCDSHILKKTFWIKCDIDYFNIIKNNSDFESSYFLNNESSFSKDKIHNFHLGHITAFITAYQRISVLEQLMEIDFDNLIRVCVDGIYFKKQNIILKNVFRFKDTINFNNIASDFYCDKVIINNPITYNCGSKRTHNNIELHLGQGGSGKTYFNCNDNGLINVLYVSPSWKLARTKKLEFPNIDVSVWNRVFNNSNFIDKIIKKYNVLIIDEISMLSDNQKNFIFDKYKSLKIIMCGDLGYQLPPVDNDVCNILSFQNIIEHKNDFRCSDPLLINIKNNLRDMIKNNYNSIIINNWVINHFKSLNKCINIDELISLYNINDMILSGTNEIKDFYTKLFINKFKNEKYYITNTNKYYCNGDIIISDVIPTNCVYQIRHCFTVHSIQGETVYNKLFIDSKKMFNSNIFYTAISRAKTLEQIFIII